ncbi:site-specific DNA-methyltransferase [Brachybacterium sp. GU-2]|uniref:site-specific DNA-methyltransferase n=1 Tax=Brachybacterium sp. GU-2 TaxID=3069708 RepID=UPI00280A59F1|nr:DNA methyltransferase [Brachybacterium sp. GU-2]WME24440.1 DNA methyltransferase [Brachybacterium sp. GU-2]
MRTHHVHVGDNLDILPTLDGPFDLIYLDPPYNTGGRVVTGYNDRFEDWTGFMAPRLAHLPRLLAEHGIVIASIDDRECHHLRVLLDDVLGARNHIGTVVWDGSTLNSSRLLSVSHDYLILYAKNHAALKTAGTTWRQPRPDAEAMLDAAARSWRHAHGDRAVAQQHFRAWLAPRRSTLPRGLIEYDRIDDTGTLYRVGDPGAPSVQASRSFRHLTHPTTGRPCPVPKRGWRMNDASMDRMLADGLIEFGPDHTTQPKLKRRLVDNATAVPRSVFRQEREGARHLAGIDGVGEFPFPKDHTVLARWFTTVTGPNARILDPFLGSGTSIEVAMALNAADGGTRTVTGIALDEGGIIENVLVPRLRYCEATYREQVSWGAVGAGPRDVELRRRHTTAA